MAHLLTPTEYAFWGILLHFISDWIFQNQWINDNKKNLTHPAGWIHGLIHLGFMLLLFPFLWALLIALLHIIIDTRHPLNWWKRVYRQTTTGEAAMHVSIWEDQVVHILIIGAVALLMTLV